MTADEIMHVLRLTAMGRVNHPEQQRLCEALEKLMAEPEGDDHLAVLTNPLVSSFAPAGEVPVWVGPQEATVCDPDAQVTVGDLVTYAAVPAPKKRAKKAD